MKTSVTLIIFFCSFSLHAQEDHENDLLKPTKNWDYQTETGLEQKKANECHYKEWHALAPEKNSNKSYKTLIINTEKKRTSSPYTPYYRFKAIELCTLCNPFFKKEKIVEFVRIATEKKSTQKKHAQKILNKSSETSNIKTFIEEATTQSMPHLTIDTKDSIEKK